MSRVLKFRAWDTNDHKMYKPFDLMKGLNDCANFHHAFAAFPETTLFLQWTGLLDKNGKEIYEGDVIRQTQGVLEVHKATKPVVWHRGAWTLGESLWNLAIYDAGDLQVIGNIYENPNLLSV